MIAQINEIIECLNKYSKINRSIQRRINILDEKMKTITKYQTIYDLGLSHTNLEFKKSMLKLQLENRVENLKKVLTKIYTDMYAIYKDVNLLLTKIKSVLKEQNTFLPVIPKIVLSEKNNVLDLKEFQKWLHKVQQIMELTKGRINLLNEKRDAFETIIRNELPSLDLHKTMNLQKEDLLNEFSRIKHKFVSIINFNHYVVKRILSYQTYQWTSQNIQKTNPNPIPKKLSKSRLKAYEPKLQKKDKIPVIKLDDLSGENEQTNQEISFTFFNSPENKR